MHFFCSGGTDHLYNFAACRSAHDGVINQDDAFAGQKFSNGIQFDLYAEVPDFGFRLDKRSADVVVTNQAECKWNSRLLGVTDRGGDARIRNRHHEIGLERIFLRQDPAHQIPAGLYRPAEDDAVRPRKINVLENTF